MSHNHDCMDHKGDDVMRPTTEAERYFLWKDIIEAARKVIELSNGRDFKLVPAKKYKEKEKEK